LRTRAPIPTPAVAQNGGADRAVADLGGDRDRAGEAGEEHARPGADLEDLELAGAGGKVVRAERDHVQRDRERDQPEHGQEEVEGGLGGALLEQLAAQLADHAVSPPVSSR
jgi:hypothetical protein